MNGLDFLPYGHPESWVTLPGGTRKQWKTLTARDHDRLARHLEAEGARNLAKAQWYMAEADKVRARLDP